MLPHNQDRAQDVPDRRAHGVVQISRRNIDQPRNRIDRDDLLIRLILLCLAMFAALAIGKLVLNTALTWWGPL